LPPKPRHAKVNPKGHERRPFAALDFTRALYFSTVVEKGSVTLAAAVLGVNASTVSRKLDELEHDLGVRILERDTRNMRLTEAGETYLHYVSRAMGTLEAGAQAMERYSSDLRGRLRVLCPPALGRRLVADLAIAFGRQHPYLQVSLKLDSSPFSLANSDFDVGLCIDIPAEERAVVAKLGEITRGYVATPGFIARHGLPKDIHALAKLPITEVAYDHYLHEQVVLVNAAGECAYAVTKLPTNDSEVALRAVLSGELIGRMMHWYCAEHLLDGRLQMVLPELNDTKAIYTVVLARAGKPLKVQLFVDYLKTHLSQELRELGGRIASPDHLNSGNPHW
jgi:LysR family transcriptional regulator, transcriptional activator for dmlA